MLSSLCDNVLNLFTERKELFLQSAPVGIRRGPEDLSVSPLPFASASDNTSVSKFLFLSEKAVRVL